MKKTLTDLHIKKYKKMTIKGILKPEYRPPTEGAVAHIKSLHPSPIL